MTQEMGKVDTLAVSQRVTLSEGRDSAPGAGVRQMLSYRYPRSFRLESHSESFHRTLLAVESDTLAIVGNQRVSDPQDLSDRYVDILFYRSRDLLQERLRLAGVDPAVSSLGRFEGKPCYILGAQYPDLTVSQIWLDKETFLPFRWLVPDSSSGKPSRVIEFRYLDWQRKGRVWYPMQIRIVEGKTATREIVVEGIQINAPMDASLFDIGYFKRKYPSVSTTHTKPGSTESRDEIQKTIEDFKRRYN